MAVNSSGNVKLSAVWYVGDKGRAIAIQTVADALRRHHGNVLASARHLHLGATTLKRWIRNTPELRAVVVEARIRRGAP
jgi:transcriptional regulator with PAS, ATPase and Fis domain